MPINHAEKDAFEAFGILYYPLTNTEEELAGTIAGADDADMAFATTCAGNLLGTGYALTPTDVAVIAGVHHWLAGQMPPESAAAASPNPYADIRELVPGITADPMYPGFPREVLEIDEARYRYHQMAHYFSTYGIELITAIEGSPVTVMRGWLPSDGMEPADIERASGGYEVLAKAKVLRLVFSRERMRDIVLERLAQPTRMHEAELRCAVCMLSAPGEAQPVDIAFHENMLELVRAAAEGTRSELKRMLERTAKHPGDVLKAITFVRTHRPYGKAHLANRQKRAFCDALEGFTFQQLATNIAEAHPEDRRSLNYLSIARFGGETLKKAAAAVESGQVKSWNSQVEEHWARLDEDGPEPLLALYRERPGMLLRSLTRLVKRGVPMERIVSTVASADAFSKATLARTLAIASAAPLVDVRVDEHPHERLADRHLRARRQQDALAKVEGILRTLLGQRLAATETPLRGKRVFVDEGDFSMEGSVVMPNDTGNTGTAYPPAGMAYRIPDDATVRFFTFWDDRSKRVDVDLHFGIRNADGTSAHVGWSGDFRKAGMVMSGDITHSQDAVEYLDLDLAAARANGVDHVMQNCHIYSGARNWKDIETCFSGAAIVQSLAERPAEGGGRIALDPQAYQAENVIFRDDLAGSGFRMDYAFIDVVDGYVRILRGANHPFTRTPFNLAAFVEMLLAAQGAQRVDSPEDADVVLSVGRSEDEDAICLIDEGFFLR